MDLGIDSFFAQLDGDLLLSEPFLTLGVLLDKSGSSLDDLANGSVLSDNLDAIWVLSDLLVGSSIKGLNGLSTEGFLPTGELSLETSGVLSLEQIVVLLDMDTENVLSVVVSVEVSLGLFFLLVSDFLSFSNNFDLLITEAGESLLVMGNVEATVAGALHCSEDFVSGGGADETNIEVSLEWASLILVVLNVVELSISLGHSLEDSVDLLVFEKSSGEEEAGGVGGSVVGKTASDTVVGELFRVSGSDGHITLDGGVNDLGEDASVSEADDHSVLLGVVLVLVVDDESLTSVVVGLSLSSSSEFSLVSL